MLKNIFLLYLVLIILLAIVPLGNSGILNNTTILSFRADHILHALIFLPWAFFCIKTNHGYTIPSAVRDCSSYRFHCATLVKSESHNKYLPLWFLWGIFFAVVSEGIQYFIPYRSFNLSDMLANGIGVVMGFVVFVLLGKELRANKS